VKQPSPWTIIALLAMLLVVALPLCVLWPRPEPAPPILLPTPTIPPAVATPLPTTPPTMVPVVIVGTVAATSTPRSPTATAIPEATAVPVTVTPALRPPPTIEGQHVVAPAQIPRKEP
jgi:hypothetical protein